MEKPGAAWEVEALVRKGVRCEAAGRNEETIDCLAKAVELSPGHAFARLHLALALSSAGRYDEAAPQVRRALELKPDSAAFRLFAGRVFFDAADYAAAGEEFRRALELSPQNDLARGCRILNDWASGARNAPLALDPETLPDSAPFLARLLMLIEMEMRSHAVEWVKENAATPWLDRPRVACLFWRAGLLRKRGRFAEAAGLADMVLEMHPGLPAAVAFRKECREGALQAAQRLVEEDPRSGRLELAALLADEERFADAEAQLSEAQRLSSEAGKPEEFNTPEVHRLRGRIAYGLGRSEEALEQVRAGAEPGFIMAEAHYYLGLCYLDQGQRGHCVAEFERLVAKVCWAVPMRFREYLEWRRAPPAVPPSAVRT